MMSMILTEATQRFFPNLEEIPEESRCSTIMKERKEEEEGNTMMMVTMHCNDDYENDDNIEEDDENLGAQAPS